MRLTLSDEEKIELNSLIDIFSDYYVGEQNISCFKKIKDLIEMDIDLEIIESISISNLKWQLNEAYEFLYSLYVDTKLVKKLIDFFDNLNM